MSRPTTLPEYRLPDLSRWRRVSAYWIDLVAFCGAMFWAALMAVILASVLSLGGCGGGVGTEGTGSFAAGPITGFGSIVVNGVHFDERAARIEDDDGALASASVLQLGTVVQVSAGAVSIGADGIASASATNVRHVRSLVGPVAAVDALGARLTVLGQSVAVTSSTAFGDSLPLGLSSLSTGQRVEVYGDFDRSSGTLAATRIALTSASTNLLRGPVSALDNAAKTFKIGSQTYSAAALGSSSGVADGAVVKLNLPAAPDANGHWPVSSARQPDDPTPGNAEVDLRGTVDLLLSSTRFVVNNRSVDASAARIDPGLRAGASVRVTGSLTQGVLMASRVVVQAPDHSDDLDLLGPITALDTRAKTLVVRGTAVSYAGNEVKFSGGVAADLILGKVVRVLGALTDNGRKVQAKSIQLVN